MAHWKIQNTISGAVLGIYEADSKQAALEKMAQKAGYASYAALEEEIPSKDGEMLVTLVKRALVSETLGSYGQRLAKELGATECTEVGRYNFNDSPDGWIVGYLIHGKQYDFKYISDNADGLGEDEDGFDEAWKKLT